jgi:hypothetical protein
MTFTPRSVPRWPVFVACLALTQSAGVGAGQLRPEPHRPIPMSLLEEHAEIAASLKAAVGAGGAVGEAAARVQALVAPHTAREQAIALPPLRLLPRLAAGETDAGMADLVVVADRLRAELPSLRREHVAIQRALEELWTAAWAAGTPEHAFLAQRINRHIRVDEEVHYPAALVAGDHARHLLETRTTRALPTETP